MSEVLGHLGWCFRHCKCNLRQTILFSSACHWAIVTGSLLPLPMSYSQSVSMAQCHLRWGRYCLSQARMGDVRVASVEGTACEERTGATIVTCLDSNISSCVCGRRKHSMSLKA